MSEREPYTYEHRVRFDEVDAAGLAYFARFFGWCHDALAAMIGGLEGGYRVLVTERRLGLPIVHVEADFASPLRFDDAIQIAVVVERLGTSSVALCFRLERVREGTHVATLRYVVVSTDLVALRAVPLPDDLRNLFARHTSGATETHSFPASRGR